MFFILPSKILLMDKLCYIYTELLLSPPIQEKTSGKIISKLYFYSQTKYESLSTKTKTLQTFSGSDIFLMHYFWRSYLRMS